MRKILSGRRGSDKGQFTIQIGVSLSDLTFQLPIPSATPTGGGALGFLVSWGDGSSDVIDASNYNGAAATHTYGSSGVKIIKISGAVRGWSFGSFPTEAAKLQQINNWGDFRFTQTQTFRNCVNMTQIDAPDTPRFDQPNMFLTFGSCTKMSRIHNIKNWNVQPITNMASFFYECDGLSQGATVGGNADLSQWDVTNVINFDFMFSFCDSMNFHMFKVDTSSVSANVPMRSMFQRCLSFNNDGFSDMNAWDTTKVRNTSFMFSAATSFNQDISNWDMSNNVSFDQMFAGNSGSAMAFNQPIGPWDTSLVASMNNIFTLCNSFDQDLSNWDLTAINSHNNTTPIMTQAIGSFGLSTANYDAMLIAWDGPGGSTLYPSMPSGSILNFGSSQYSAAPSSAATAHGNLVTKWGGIIDGGPI